MIICISPSDNFVVREVLAYAQQYQEDCETYGNRYFKPTDTRITIVGHGNVNTLGDLKLTPEMLVADLISLNIPRRCVIDLVCCGGDDIPENFAERALNLFIQHSYPDIQINYFSNRASTQSHSIVSVSTGLMNNFAQLSGLTPAARKMFDEELATAPYQQLETTVKKLEEKKLALKIELRELKLKGAKQTEIKNVSDQANEAAHNHKLLEKMYLIKKRRNLIEIYEELKTDLYSDSSDIRTILDDNPNFQITAASLKDTKALTSQQKKIICLLHNRTAELRRADRESKRSPSISGYFYSFFSPPDEKHISYQLEKLRYFVQQIKTCHHEDEIIELIREGANDAKFENDANRKLAENILAELSIHKDCLPSLIIQSIAI
jgi:hypothetical protein